MTETTFDPLAPAASATTLTLDVLLDPPRAARMQRFAAPGFDAVIDGLLEQGWSLWRAAVSTLQGVKRPISC